MSDTSDDNKIPENDRIDKVDIEIPSDKSYTDDMTQTQFCVLVFMP